MDKLGAEIGTVQDTIKQMQIRGTEFTRGKAMKNGETIEYGEEADMDVHPSVKKLVDEYSQVRAAKKKRLLDDHASRLRILEEEHRVVKNSHLETDSAI